MLKKASVYVLASISLLIIIIGCDNNGPEPPVTPEAYCHWMPTDLGNRWEYRVTVDSKYNPSEEYKLVYEIKSIKQSYEGFPKAYVITITKEGIPTELILACDEDKCYVERAMWSYLIEDEMVIGVWNQTGLVEDTPLQYVRDVNVRVPAGEWPCREFAKDNGKEFKPEEWHEYFAEDIGLVKYTNYYREYKGSEPPELVDWRNEEYVLLSYDIAHTDALP